jgi:hypothetical protein
MPVDMTESAGAGPGGAASLPDLILYARDGCHLCDEARETLRALLRERAAHGLPVPRLVDRDIATNPGWERAFLTTIPVVELGGQRLELATSAARLRRLLDDVLPLPTSA